MCLRLSIKTQVSALTLTLECPNTKESQKTGPRGLSLHSDLNNPKPVGTKTRTKQGPNSLNI